MSTSIEDVRVHNDYAIRCSIVCKPVNILDYVKAVSSVIGASHILAVFEEKDSIKVFLNDKRCVDTLVRSCLHVMGHHIKVDYASPPGTRLILTDVDPIVSNYDIMRLLSVYGTVVSPVIRPPISDDTELCHIGYGVRYVYMNLANESVPEKIEFKYGEHMFSFKIQIETSDVVVLANMKVDTFDESLLENDNSNSSNHSQTSPPVLVSVQSLDYHEELCENPSKLPNTGLTVDQVPVKKKQRGRPPGPVKRMRMVKRITATSKAARRIKRNVKHNWIRKHYKKGTAVNKQHLKNASSILKTAAHTKSSNSTINDVSTASNETKEEPDSSYEILELDRLKKFLHEVKNHRAPLEVAKKYLNNNYDSIYKLIKQLETFRKQQTELNFKNRIWRLIKSLRDSLNNPSQSISSDS